MIGSPEERGKGVLLLGLAFLEIQGQGCGSGISRSMRMPIFGGALSWVGAPSNSKFKICKVQRVIELLSLFALQLGADGQYGLIGLKPGALPLFRAPF